METVLIALLGLLVTLATFYAKDADVLSDKSLRFTKTLIIIVAAGTIITGLVYVVTKTIHLLL